MTTPPKKNALSSLLLALCCRAVKAGGVSIPSAAAPVVTAVAEEILETAVAELTVRVPEAASTVAKDVAEAAAKVVQDVSGMIPAVGDLAPVLATIAEVAEQVEAAVESKPGTDPAPPLSSEPLPSSPALTPVPEEPKSQGAVSSELPQ